MTNLCTALDYFPAPANRVQRGLQHAAQSKPGAWVFQRTLYRIDRPLHRWSKGRYTVPGVLTGLPTIMLTTTGAKSGLARVMPVAGIPDVDGSILVMGTNYAQQKTPAWAINLSANPDCTVTWKNTSVAAVAQPITDELSRERAWARATAAYVGFAAYRERITHREVRIFRLVSATT